MGTDSASPEGLIPSSLTTDLSIHLLDDRSLVQADRRSSGALLGLERGLDQLSPLLIVLAVFWPGCMIAAAHWTTESCFWGLRTIAVAENPSALVSSLVPESPWDEPLRYQPPLQSLVHALVRMACQPLGSVSNEWIAKAISLVAFGLAIVQLATLIRRQFGVLAGLFAAAGLAMNGQWLSQLGSFEPHLLGGALLVTAWNWADYAREPTSARRGLWLILSAVALGLCGLQSGPLMIVGIPWLIRCGWGTTLTAGHESLADASGFGVRRAARTLGTPTAGVSPPGPAATAAAKPIDPAEPPSSSPSSSMPASGPGSASGSAASDLPASGPAVEAIHSGTTPVLDAIDGLSWRLVAVAVGLAIVITVAWPIWLSWVGGGDAWLSWLTGNWAGRDSTREVLDTVDFEWQPWFGVEHGLVWLAAGLGPIAWGLVSGRRRLALGTQRSIRSWDWLWWFTLAIWAIFLAEDDWRGDGLTRWQMLLALGGSILAAYGLARLDRIAVPSWVIPSLALTTAILTTIALWQTDLVSATGWLIPATLFGLLSLPVLRWQRVDWSLAVADRRWQRALYVALLSVGPVWAVSTLTWASRDLHRLQWLESKARVYQQFDRIVVLAPDAVVPPQLELFFRQSWPAAAYQVQDTRKLDFSRDLLPLTRDLSVPRLLAEWSRIDSMETQRWPTSVEVQLIAEPIRFEGRRLNLRIVMPAD